MNQEQSGESLPKQGSKVYEVADTHIRLGWKRFEAQDSKEGDPKTGEATIFLMGWAMDENSKSMQGVSQAFADSSHHPAYAVSTRPEAIRPDSLYEEAQAISQFVLEQDIKSLTIAGYSEGTIKAVDLAVLTQKINEQLPQDKKLTVKGVVLLDPVGLYEQGRARLTAKFTMDALIQTLPALLRETRDPKVLKKFLASGMDVVFGVLADIRRFGRRYPQRVLNQVEEFVRINPQLGEVRAPIVLIQGEHDAISQMSQLVPDVQNTTWSQGKNEEGEYANVRESFLKRIFPNSPYIRAVQPEKMGHHTLPILRDQSVARSANFLLQRFWRNQPPAETETHAEP